MKIALIFLLFIACYNEKDKQQERVHRKIEAEDQAKNRIVTHMEPGPKVERNDDNFLDQHGGGNVQDFLNGLDLASFFEFGFEPGTGYENKSTYQHNPKVVKCMKYKPKPDELTSLKKDVFFIDYKFDVFKECGVYEISLIPSQVNEYEYAKNQFLEGSRPSSKSEYVKDMLKSFLEWWVHHTPDILTGWNVNLYDVPYICGRMERLFGETALFGPSIYQSRLAVVRSVAQA